MTTLTRSFAACAIPVAALVLEAEALRAQSYGDHDQTLTIGAAEFEPADTTNGEGYLDADGYVYASSGPVDWFAPMSLPDGAEVTQLCLFANDADPVYDVSAEIVERFLPVPGQLLGYNTFGTTQSTGTAGYGEYCSAPFSRTILNVDHITADLLEATSYRIHVEKTGSLGFGGVRITWHRQVSPPPATPTFADVPASDPAWPYVEALAASGITAGCGNGDYCPDATLTRRQMAVFLAKALGLHWTN
jgi:hypothetical protein